MYETRTKNTQDTYRIHTRTYTKRLQYDLPRSQTTRPSRKNIKMQLSVFIT